MNQKNDAPAGPLMLAPRTTDQQSGFIAGAPSAELTGYKAPRNLPQVLKYSYTNSSGSTTNLMLFDPIGAVASVTGLTVVTPTPNVLTNAIINNYFASNPILFNGFRMECTSTAQFNEQVQYYSTDFNGRLNKEIIDIETGVTGAKYDETIQYYDTKFIVNSWIGIVIPVLNGQTIYLTFEPGREWNRI